MLKRIRIYLSSFILLLFLILFLEFDGINVSFSKILLNTQFFPVFMKGFLSGSVHAIIVFVLIVVLTLAFGRVYCSTLCPLGTIQDFFIFLRYKFKRKKRFTFFGGYTKLRYILVSAVFVSLFAGSMFAVNLLEPYSNFGRMAANLFKPFVYLIFETLPKSYFIPEIKAHVMTFALFSYTLGFFVFISILSFYRGRLFCNTLCPVGAILGVISKKQKFKYVFDETTCNGCGICSNVCKSECLDHKNKSVDTQRCVACFNCVNSCPKGSISYCIPKNGEDKERRRAVKSIAVAGAAVASLSIARPLAAAVFSSAQKGPIIPPGAKDLHHFNSKCTACHLCVTACPQKVLSISMFEYGLNGIMQPKMDFEESYCLYKCTVCSEVCPTGAIRELTKAEKIVTKIGTSKIDKKKCIPYYSSDNCTVCSEHCPTKAVYSVYYKGRLAPVVKDSVCIGCGACEHVCPSKKGKAIVVTGLLQHKIADNASKAQRPGYWRDVDKKKQGGNKRRKRNASTEDFPF